MTWQTKALATKPEDQSSGPRTRVQARGPAWWKERRARYPQGCSYPGSNVSVRLLTLRKNVMCLFPEACESSWGWHLFLLTFSPNEATLEILGPHSSLTSMDGSQSSFSLSPCYPGMMMCLLTRSESFVSSPEPGSLSSAFQQICLSIPIFTA